jgi:hypothetical protein
MIRPCRLALGLFALSACSTVQTVTELPSTARTENPPGIPFRVLAPYTVRVFMRSQSGGYQPVYVQSLDLPDQTRLFALNVRSDFFSNHQLQLSFNNDSTLSTSSVTTTTTAAPALAATATQLSTVGDSVVNFNNTRRTQESLTLQNQTALTQQQTQNAQAVAALQKQQPAPQVAREAALVAALQAWNTVQAGQRSFDSLPSTTSANDHANAEANLRLLKLQANQAFQAAGLPDPYPGIFP